MKTFKYLIVGGGMTADAAVKGIRQVDESGDIGIIGAEPDPPYARPPLTKDLWTSETSLEDIEFKTEAKGATVICSTRVVSLNMTKQEVVDEVGGVYRYEKLLLATGGAPRHLSIGDGHIIYFRTAADYRNLRERVDNADRFAVLGGGFIGSELAAALTMNDRQVTMVFPEGAVCARMLPADFAMRLNRYYEDRGVVIMNGQKPSSVGITPDLQDVYLENGEKISAEGIVAGLGIEPNTELAVNAGLDVDDGIVVDECLRTKHPDVYAAGDVAAFYNPALDRRLRVEHEDNALTMGEMAGRNMAGEKQPYHHLPYFYSDVFDVGYEAIGLTDPALEVVTDLKDPQANGCIFYMEQDRVRGIVFWNLFEKAEAGRELIAAPGPHTTDALKAWEKERLAE